ncbi:RHS repeat-associated core domain-containing protein [Chitinimonas lacunae]|uniref:RHS repeat-associated core domain-containing protein n=1 Tax=Chitinimonas lacunae TaxID=1963018 RepID=A0ABV8MUW7_9NEIS
MNSFKCLTLAVLAALGPLTQAEVVSSQTFSYDGRGNLISATNGAGQTTRYQPDASGRITATTDPQGRITRYGYDVLGRTTQVTRPDTKVERYDYDSLDRLISVTDARGLTTRYEVNAFNETLKRSSPDTGAGSASYDADGRLFSRTNAAGQTVSYRYDAAGRLVEQSHAAGPKWSFVWDAKNRLSEIKDPNATTRYVYDAEGHITTKTQILGTLTHSIAYRWAADDQLSGLTTPSGRKIDYQLKNGQIVGITLDGKPLLTTVAYHPNGAPQGWSWANGLHHTRLFDKAERLYRIESAGIIAKLLTFDAAGNVDKIDDLLDKTRNQDFGYDDLDRLISEMSAGRNDSYQYDANGNRTLMSRNGAATPYAIDAASNKLTSVASQARTYATTGHLLSDGAKTFQYDSAERMIRATVGGTTYQYAYNALGQRVIKTGTRFVFDEAGRLLGEYKTDGSLIQETVWLGNLPVATIRPDPTDAKKTVVYYVHPDHLGSPRAVSEPSSNKTLWRWESDAFGQGAANEDVDGDKRKFVYHLRFPGQYFDSESGLNYNYFRNYDSQTGRYLESDPIGLNGGWNTYAYALNNSPLHSDPKGLSVEYCADGIHKFVCLNDKCAGLQPTNTLIGAIGIDRDGAIMNDSGRKSGAQCKKMDVDTEPRCDQKKYESCVARSVNIPDSNNNDDVRHDYSLLWGKNCVAWARSVIIECQQMACTKPPQSNAEPKAKK